MLSSSMSMRRIAKVLKVNRKTVKRKLIYLAKKAKLEHQDFLKTLQQNKIMHIQFDDLITMEHTKLKPLSVTMAVDAKTRKFLGVDVSPIPAFGLLAEKSRKKYGFRKSEHQKGLTKIFDNLKNIADKNVLIESDEHPFYPKFTKEYFPHAKHKRYKGGRGCVVGQGELKRLNYDPLFTLNHNFAMLRANINRLVRKTWCTTKRPDMLLNHLMIYINYHNQYLV